MQRPLADEIRPKTLDEVVGQRHLLSPGAVLRRLIDSGTEANMVFYGPSGTGKPPFDLYFTFAPLNFTFSSLRLCKCKIL